MNEERDPIPANRLQLEKYIAGRLPATEAEALETRLRLDPVLAKRVEEMRAQDAAFAVRFPAEQVVPVIRAAARKDARTAIGVPSQQTKPFLERIGLGALAFPAFPRFAIAMALLVLCALPVLMLRKPVIVSEERMKGKETELRIYRNTPAGPEKMADGSPATAGDVLQAEFRPGRYAYGAVFSVDGNGAVTLHWPSRPDSPTALAALPDRRLPAAFQLDASPRFERFHMVLASAPLDIQAWLALAAKSAGQDAKWLAAQAGDSVHVLTLTLKKGL